MRRGTDTALHVFVEGRRTALFRSAYLLCGNRDEAEDLVQTTLVRVVLGARRHGRLDNLDAYARRTLVNTFVSGRRRFWRREHAYGALDDGTMLTLSDLTGFSGVRSQGPPLKTYPLTRAQLRELALSDELLP